MSFSLGHEQLEGQSQQNLLSCGIPKFGIVNEKLLFKGLESHTASTTQKDSPSAKKAEKSQDAQKTTNSKEKTTQLKNNQEKKETLKQLSQKAEQQIQKAYRVMVKLQNNPKMPAEKKADILKSIDTTLNKVQNNPILSKNFSTHLIELRAGMVKQSIDGTAAGYLRSLRYVMPSIKQLKNIFTNMWEDPNSLQQLSGFSRFFSILKDGVTAPKQQAETQYVSSENKEENNTKENSQKENRESKTPNRFNFQFKNNASLNTAESIWMNKGDVVLESAQGTFKISLDGNSIYFLTDQVGDINNKDKKPTKKSFVELNSAERKEVQDHLQLAHLISQKREKLFSFAENNPIDRNNSNNNLLLHLKKINELQSKHNKENKISGVDVFNDYLKSSR